VLWLFWEREIKVRLVVGVMIRMGRLVFLNGFKVTKRKKGLERLIRLLMKIMIGNNIREIISIVRIEMK